MIQFTCCFTGHRPEKLFDRYDEAEIYNRIVYALENAIADGYKTFLCGGSRGADFLFAEAVIALKATHPDIRLEFMLPCRNQSELWSREDRDRYSNLLELGDSVFCLSDKYTNGCMQNRNRVMVERSSLLIAAWNGTEGGTEYTYKYARKRKLRIVDIIDRLPEETDQLSFL